MSPKKIAIRTCVGCQQRRPQEELWRFGEGRHGYLCYFKKDEVTKSSPQVSTERNRVPPRRGGVRIYDQECFEKAVKKNAFSRALKRKVSENEQNKFRQEFEKEVKIFKAQAPHFGWGEDVKKCLANPSSGGDGNGTC